MRSSEFLDIIQRDACLEVYLNRPKKANAYHAPLLDALESVVDDLAQTSEIRVLIIGARGPNFCAGADRKSLKNRSRDDILNLQSQRVFQKVFNLPQITIAAMNGPAIAGGFELAMACDFRLATPQLRLALPETRLGIIPAAGGTQRLKALVGLSRAKMVILGGLELDAPMAMQWGLLREIVKSDELIPTCRQFADKLCERRFEAQKLAKAALHHDGDLATGLRLETLMQAHLKDV